MAYRIISTACNLKVDRVVLSGLSRGILPQNLKVNWARNSWKIELISQHSLVFLQPRHDLALLTRNDERISLYEAFLNQWRVLLSGETPKSSKSPKPAESDSSKPPNDSTKPRPAKSSSDPSNPPEWNFGMFGPNPADFTKGSSNQGQGRPGGGKQPPDQTGMLIFGTLAAIVIVSALTHFHRKGYKEISWLTFVNE